MEAGAPAPPPRLGILDPRLAALLISVVLTTADSSALNLALPTLARYFSTTAEAVQWVVSLSLAGAALSFLPMSALAGRIGTVRVYRYSLLAFSILSLALAAAPSLPVLLLLRFLQGVASAGVVGLVPGLAAATFPDRRGWALGMVAGSVAAGYMLGPPLGGALIDFVGWRSIFLLNLPFGAAAFFLSRNLGELRSVGLIEGVRRTLAAPRFLLALLGTALFFAQLFGAIILWPFFLDTQGVSASQSGLYLLVPPVILLLFSPWAGHLADRHGAARVSLIGSLVLTVVSVLQGWTASVAIGLVGLGFGRALFQAANNSAVLSQAPEGTEAVASCLLSMARVSGQALGSVLIGAVWVGWEPAGPRAAFLMSNLLLAALAALAGVLTLGWGRFRRKEPEPAFPGS
ncbi:MAG: MFS transporter [Desulfuromonadales bacterium]|nr:MFS transporter [Desulfuromonadales bacterium]